MKYRKKDTLAKYKTCLIAIINRLQSVNPEKIFYTTTAHIPRIARQKLINWTVPALQPIVDGIKSFIYNVAKAIKTFFG